MSHTLKAQPSSEYAIYKFTNKHYAKGSRRGDRLWAITVDLNELGD